MPDAGGNATLCVNSGNCIGGTGSAPNTADYLVVSLNGTLTNERALTGGSNISFTDGGAGSNFTVATVQNPTFTTSVTTPLLQSSGALTLTSAAGTVVAIDAGTTIELQDSTNVTGSLDVSAAFTAGTGNAFQVNGSGAIAAAAGITSAGTIVFSGLDCTGNLNGGALTTNASGQLMCSDDDAGAGAIAGSGSAGTIPLFNGAQSITNSIITQSGTTITVAGDLNLNTQLSVSNGGTGATTFNARGLLYGNGTGALQATAAGTGGQVLIANASGVPTFATFSGDVAVSNTGVTTIQADSVALGTDTTGNYVANLGTLTGLSTSGNTGEGSTPTLSVAYGSIANTAVQGNVTLTCPAGAGNLSGGGNSVTLGAGGSCNNISIINNPTFSTSVTTPAMILTGAGSNGAIQVANLGQGTVYTLPDPGGAAATICISTGNCTTAGAAGGDLTGTYPNPTIAKLQNTNLTITSPAAGHILVYNGTSGDWENKAITGDIAISETGASTVQADAVALGTDTTGDYVLGLSAGTGVSVTGSAGEGWTPTVNVVYGSSANTAVQGNTGITVTAGTNLTGGGSITLGTGGTVILNVSNSPTFSGTLAVQGATATIGGAAQQGSVVLNDGSSNTGMVQTAPLGQNTTYTLPDPGSSSATICLSTGNCAGSGTGVTTSGGTTNRLSKFTGAQALGDSTISDDGTTVTINGTANFVVQGGTGTFGTLTQSGTLAVSDGSSNTVSIVTAALAANRTYTLPDVGGNATFCLDTGNCLGGGSGGAPNNAAYLLASLDGTLTNDRALTGGTNISLTDGGAGGNFTVATVANPAFSTSVTTPVLQSSGALTISSAAGNTVAIDAGTTIELQDSTNVTGSLDVSAAFTSGTSNAFQVSSAGAITAATGIASAGTITFSGLNCTTFANGGALTTNASGQLMCSDDDGGAGGAISGSGTNGTLTMFGGTNTVTDSIVTQSGTTVTIAGDLTLNTRLSVANGGTGATSFTSHGLLYGNAAGAIQVTAAGTGGQVLIANASGVPTFASFTGDVAVSNTGVTTIQADSVALGTDTTGSYVANLGALTGLTTSGNSGEGSAPTLSVTYGSAANTAVQGNTALTCASGSGNLSGGGNSVTLGAGGSCNNISIINNPTFSTSVTTPSLILTGAGSNGTVQVANLGQTTTYTLPDPGGAAASFCLTTGNCSATGTAGGDLTGSYPNPTIAKLQSGTLTITSVASGNILQYNGSAWVNQNLTGDVTLNSSAVATIQPSSVNSSKIADGTIANVDLATGSFSNITGVGTLGGLTVVGAASINASGTANTSIGNATGTFQVASSALNISTAGALSGVASIATSGGYTQTGSGANTFSGASSFTAAGTALSVTNDVTVGGIVTVNTISPNSALTVGVTGQSFTVQGNALSTIKATDTGNTTTLGFATPTANTTINLPALAAGAYTLCTSSGNCGGVGATLQTAYTNSTNPEIVLDATRGALTIRDTSGGLAANLFEVQSNNGSTTYFNVTATGVNTTGTNTSSGNVNTTGGALQTASTDRITNAGNLVNIGTITTSGAINSQTISSAANFTGTLTIQGANALTLGTASTNTGAIVLKGSGGAGTLTLAGPTTPNAGNFTLTIPAITASANVCTDNSICTGYAAAAATGFYLQQVPTSNSAGAVGANVIAPTTASIVGLAVNATTSMSAVAATFTQANNTSPADTVQISTTNTAATQTNGLLFNRNGASGTTTNGINVTNTAGTLTNGLAFTGTIGTDIFRGAGTLTLQGTGGVSVTTPNVSGASSAITLQTGNSSTGTAGNVSIDTGTTSTGTPTVNIGNANAKAVQIGNNTSNPGITIDSGTGTIAIGTGAQARTINFGTGGAVQGITIGSTNTTSSTSILGGTTGSINIGSVASSTLASATHIADTNNATGMQSVTIGSLANTANTVAMQGGSLTLSTSSASAGTLFKTTANSTAALQVQNSTSDSLFNMTTVAKTSLTTNPGFETNTTAPWATVNGGTVALSRITSQSYAQAASMQVAITSATQWAGAKYPISLTSGQSYTLSFFAKSSSGTPLIDAGYSNTGAFAGEVDCIINYPTIYTTGWMRFSCTLTAGAPSGSPYIYIETPTAATATFLLDNVQLTQSATDNGAYYSGQIDFTGSALSGQLALQPTNDSTSVFQVFSSAGVPVIQVDTINKQVSTPQLLITDNYTDPTKAWRFRTNGSGLDFEASGGTGPGSMWISGWSNTGGSFSGTQYTFLRTDPTLNQPIVTLGAGFGTSTPTLTVLDTKNTSGDPTYGTNGAMYYNSNTNAFRCYQNGAWTNCIGVTTSDSFRQQPFYSTDFFVDASTGGGGTTTAACAPWWNGVVGSAGATTPAQGVANHPGLVHLHVGAIANSGAYYETSINGILLAGGESFEAVFRTPAAFTNTTVRMGFLDTTSTADATDGAYIEFSGSGVLSGKTANGGTRSVTGTTTTLSASTFYRVKITDNSNASTITYAVYNDGASSPVWTNTLSANIPTTATHETGSGVIAYISTASPGDLLDMDYMAMWLSQALSR